MLTCKECVHYDACHRMDREIPAESCKTFKNKTDIVEVIRCKDCKHLKIINTDKIYAVCEAPVLTQFYPFEIDTRKHFCSYGKNKEED